jgi:hypothetical protein
MADALETMEGAAGVALDARYGLEVDIDSVGRLCEERRLSFPSG